MTTQQRIRREVVPPISEKDKEMAKAAQRCIMASLDHSRAAAITLETDSGNPPKIELPPTALKLIGQVLGALSEGQAVTVIPSQREFTTVEAAHFLNVSRPFVIKEIKEGRLQHRMVGTHRRIAFEDLVAYERGMREQQNSALQGLADDAKDLKLSY